ncbi:MAG: hypothetical protein M3083_20495 [Actinomycetota bacterium]|nr:hypothetical protein [Actinomycetota bacterium]MDQ6947170.1 hypothetical protein [Actinomycetota bacterium]
MALADPPLTPAVPPVIPGRGAISGGQAFLAIALVFFLGVLIGLGIGLSL